LFEVRKERKGKKGKERKERKGGEKYDNVVPKDFQK